MFSSVQSASEAQELGGEARIAAEYPQRIAGSRAAAAKPRFAHCLGVVLGYVLAALLNLHDSAVQNHQHLSASRHQQNQQLIFFHLCAARPRARRTLLLPCLHSSARAPRSACYLCPRSDMLSSALHRRGARADPQSSWVSSGSSRLPGACRPTCASR